MVKPHNGPSALLVINATCHNAVQDASGFSGFGLNGFPKWFSSGLAGGKLNNWGIQLHLEEKLFGDRGSVRLNSWISHGPTKNYFGGRGSSKILYYIHYCGSSAPKVLGTEEPLILCNQNGPTYTVD